MNEGCSSDDHGLHQPRRMACEESLSQCEFVITKHMLSSGDLQTGHTLQSLFVCFESAFPLLYLMPASTADAAGTTGAAMDTTSDGTSWCFWLQHLTQIATSPHAFPTSAPNVNTLIGLHLLLLIQFEDEERGRTRSDSVS